MHLERDNLNILAAVSVVYCHEAYKVFQKPRQEQSSLILCNIVEKVTKDFALFIGLYI